MSVTDGWTERGRDDDGEGRVSKPAVRSLRTALFEAGLGEYPQDPPGVARRRAIDDELDSAARAAVSEPVAMPRIAQKDQGATGVVSPPPWLREAQRGRRRSRVHNAFGWLMTLVVAGSIIGLAGHLLIGEPAFQSFLTARQ
jgi:hypothetical protein